ncbi:TonB-dependent receptor [Dickeya poaceiphila]|uniref:TonB-dependent receptor n=1 Tax=Dickeya poaceiphila TaxID=568768 RepID=A0A5B8ILM8_9GAMM|nr:TonB-dependent receptor [Dickeya poaceiphila]QDX32010.1 TonB-dependent receptor [Dickeya poaceiphila]
MKVRALYALTPLFLFAQADAADNTNKNENEIVVTASRTDTEKKDSPQVVTIITKEQIDQQRQITSDSSQILSNLLPAMAPSRQKMSGSGETFRGRAPLILVDGIPQSNPLRPTGREMHTIDFAMVDHIEVIHGASASNGIGATGGVINIITRRPEPGSFNQHFSVEATSPTSRLDGDTMSYKTTYGFSGREEYLDYLFSVSYEDQGLFLDGKNRPIGVDNTQGDLMDSRAYDVMAKVGYWLDNDQRVQLSLNRYQIKGKMDYLGIAGDRNNGIPTTSVSGRPVGDAPMNSVWTTSATYDNYNLAGMKFSSLAYYQNYESLFGADTSDSFQDVSLAPLKRLYDQSRVTSSRYGTKVTLTKDDIWDDYLKATVGFDTLFDTGKQDLWLTQRIYAPEMKYTDLSPFMQWDIKPVDSLKITTGVRYEYARLDIDSFRTVAASTVEKSNNSADVQGGRLSFNKTLYNVGAVWTTPYQPLSLFANYSQGFGIPDVGRTLREIKIPNQSVNMLLLEPIVTDNVETGFRIQKDPVEFELSYYRSTSKLGERVEDVNGTFQSKRQKTRIDGIETSLGYKVNDDHRLKVGYSHIQGWFDSDGNGSLDGKLDGLNIPPDRLTASWSANWTPQWSSFIQANYAFDRIMDKRQQDFNGYLLVDAAVGYKLPKGKVNLAVSNLFDREYITYYSQSAIVNSLRYFSGRGRTVTLGYSVDF